MTTLYLESYLDSLEPLPGELRRNFTLMHDMDQKNKGLLNQIDSSSDEYLQKARDLSASERSAEMEKIQKMFRKAKEHGDDKVNIAIQTYEMVDKHIRRLDSDLAKFEAEMREQGGRLSQTETEDEEVTNKQKKKVGRKPGSGKDDKLKKQKGKRDAEDSDKGKKKKGKNAAKESPVVSTVPGIPGVPGIPQEVLDMPVDPNEPTYCLCQQVSYGEMIGCDNNDCPIEWFHFGCMQLTTKPKGKWYCPKCLPLFKKKK